MFLFFLDMVHNGRSRGLLASGLVLGVLIIANIVFSNLLRSPFPLLQPRTPARVVVFSIPETIVIGTKFQTQFRVLTPRGHPVDVGIKVGKDEINPFF
jgi:hypothetical protein